MIDHILIHAYAPTHQSLRKTQEFKWKLKLPSASRDAGYVRVLYRSLRNAGLDAVAARQHVILGAIAFSSAYPTRDF
jgi:hypothetical protein